MAEKTGYVFQRPDAEGRVLVPFYDLARLVAVVRNMVIDPPPEGAMDAKQMKAWLALKEEAIRSPFVAPVPRSRLTETT